MVRRAVSISGWPSSYMFWSVMPSSPTARRDAREDVDLLQLTAHRHSGQRHRHALEVAHVLERRGHALVGHVATRSPFSPARRRRDRPSTGGGGEPVGVAALQEELGLELHVVHRQPVRRVLDRRHDVVEADNGPARRGGRVAWGEDEHVSADRGDAVTRERGALDGARREDAQRALVGADDAVEAHERLGGARRRAEGQLGHQVRRVALHAQAVRARVHLDARGLIGGHRAEGTHASRAQRGASRPRRRSG